MKTKIKELAKKYQRVQSLMCFINEKTLREAYEKQAESDIKQKYGKHLDSNISELLRRMKKSSYFPQSKDWLQTVNVDRDNEKYMFRAFEDRMLQYLFKEILEALFEPQIRHMRRDLKKKDSAMVPRRKLIIAVAVAVIEIDVAWYLRGIAQERLIDLMKQRVADGVFIRYCERFLQSGVKLLGECTDMESESAACFVSMMRNVCECYILQLLDSTMKNDFGGVMWVVSNDKGVKIMFEKSMDCNTAYRQLCHELQKIGIELVEDNIRFEELLSPKNYRNARDRTSASVNHHMISRGKKYNS